MSLIDQRVIDNGGSNASSACLLVVPGKMMITQEKKRFKKYTKKVCSFRSNSLPFRCVLRPPSVSFLLQFFSLKLESFFRGVGINEKTVFFSTAEKNLSLLTHIKSFDSWLFSIFSFFPSLCNFRVNFNNIKKPTRETCCFLKPDAVHDFLPFFPLVYRR